MHSDRISGRFAPGVGTKLTFFFLQGSTYSSELDKVRKNLQQAISELPCTSFSKRALVHSFSYENEYSFTCIHKTYFHLKGFARGLPLEKRHKTIRKWPIA